MAYKSTGKRKTSKRASSSKADLVTVPYSMVIFYVLVGLIIGLALGALALLWVEYDQRTNGSSLDSSLEDSIQGQILRSTRIR